MTFSDLNLIEPILKALDAEGYTTPTPIQQQAIPYLLEERDLLGIAQTGTGKTAAFAIPILQLLDQNKLSNKGPRAIRALILTPTRELAIQIDESIAAYGRHMNLRHTVIFGGVSQHAQVNALRAGIDILVATPGRLLDLMGQGYINLRSLERFVLDEADRMLDMGFIHDVRKVIAQLPTRRQSLFFSATMPPEVAKLADTILNKPAKVEVTPVSTTADTVDQVVYFVDKPNKKKLLVDVLQERSIRSALVFTRTKHGADHVVKDLRKASIEAEAIHGNKSQNARQRALSRFKSGELRVLIATDIAARGIDVDELSCVINYEIPNIPETYVHRIGRTGRAGHEGRAMSFCDEEEQAYLRDIQKLIGKQIPVVSDHEYAMAGVSVPLTRPNQSRQQAPTNGASANGRPNGPRPNGQPGGGGNRNRNRNRRFGQPRRQEPKV
ncbi:DEAD/DEAH box helicase [Rudanella lutea]|uniref:DEAD/DEAH box helicase n=1 Tax=Rudanella lutea TaxID=451374 RepID=UPI00037ABEBC|nr:DEAD/DEAH box helicase [Rudanella lutea]